MDHRERECEGMNVIYLAQGRDQRRAVVSAVMNLLFPRKSMNFLTVLVYC
jgi:hypothetical protein